MHNPDRPVSCNSARNIARNQDCLALSYSPSVAKCGSKCSTGNIFKIEILFSLLWIFVITIHSYDLWAIQFSNNLRFTLKALTGKFTLSRF